MPENVKTARLTQIIELQNELSLESNRRDVGRTFEVLVEGVSKRRDDQLFGRTSQNKVVVFDRGTHRAGEYVTVRDHRLYVGHADRRSAFGPGRRDARTLTLCDSGTAEERCRNRPRRLPIPAVRETRRYPPAGISRRVFHLTKQRPRGSSRTHLFRSKRPAFF